ncbi:unnamed protein product [Pedinophyceae sp. YPF-701]|nr:unnamed protein product [Pedinophyceae sp. YPF-701]
MQALAACRRCAVSSHRAFSRPQARRLIASSRAAASSGSSGPAETERRVSHILLKGSDARERAEALAATVGNETFASMAKEMSECPSGKAGGDLGWISRGQMVPAFEEAAFSTDVGSIALVDTQFGSHLVRVVGERAKPTIRNMSVSELQERLCDPSWTDQAVLVDVREPGEHDAASLPGFMLYPLSQFNSWAGDFAGASEADKAREHVILCHHGIRSMQLAAFLTQQGYSNVANVSGGIDAYARMDNSVPRY